MLRDGVPGQPFMSLCACAHATRLLKEINQQHLKWLQNKCPRFERWEASGRGRYIDKTASSLTHMLGPRKRCDVCPAKMGHQLRRSASGTVSVGDWLVAHLAGDSAVVCAALPETPAVACDVSDLLVLIGEVHLPDQRPVTKNPHLFLAPPPPHGCGQPLCCSPRGAGRECSLPDASYRLRSSLTAWLVAQSTLGLEFRGTCSDLVNIFLFPCLGYQEALAF